MQLSYGRHFSRIVNSSKFSQQLLLGMMKYAWDLSQLETDKYFE